MLWQFWRAVGNSHDPGMALPKILTMVPGSRPFKDGHVICYSCCCDDVYFQYRCTSSIQFLFPWSYKLHANRQQSFCEATGERAWLKGRYPSMNTEAQKSVKMALTLSEYIISTDPQIGGKRCISSPSQSCKLSFSLNEENSADS